MFSGLNLNNTDEKLLNALLKAGRSSPPQLSFSTSIPRTTVYSSLKKLSEKSLIQQEISDGKLFYNVSSPEEIESLINQEEREFEKSVKDLKTIQKIFAEQKLLQQYVMPRFRFIRDEEMSDFLFDNIKKWSSFRGRTLDWWGYQDPSFAENYSSWINAFWKQAPEDLKLCFLTKKSAVEEAFMATNRYPNRKIIFSNDFSMDSSLWIIGHFVFFLYTQKKPHYGIFIESSSIAESLRGAFKKLWLLNGN